MESLGKLVYLLACFFNSISIFTSQTFFFASGINFLFVCLCIFIRYTVGFDPFDDFPNSNEYIIYFLIIVFVIMPLTLIPIRVAKFLKNTTDNFVLFKTFHQNERNRSGYDVTGLDTALFMFLPSSTNNFQHLCLKNKVFAGFSYFSEDKMSRKLYKLKFETALFCKCTMHVFYLLSSFILINIFHIGLQESTIDNQHPYLGILDVPAARIMGL